MMRHHCHNSKKVEATVSLPLLLRNLRGAAYRCVNDEHWTMEFVSAGIEDLTGYAPQVFTARSAFTFASIIHPADREGVAAKIEWALALGRPFEVSYRIITFNAGVKWVWEQGAGVRDKTGEVRALEGFITDITQIKNSEVLLRERAALLDQARDAIFVMDMGARITYWNKGAQRLYGWSSSHTIGRTYRELFGENAGNFQKKYETTIIDGEWAGECIHLNNLGYEIATEARWTLIPADEEAGSQQKILTITSDITERKDAETKITRLAYYDTLTDLPNRINLLDHLRRALESSARSGSFGALLFCDLDNFKEVNDTRGHAAGDALLQAVARRLEKCVRTTDLVARLGGDEFVVMLPPVEQSLDEVSRSASSVAAKIIASLSTPVQLLGNAHPVSTSIGATLFSGTCETVESVMMKADSAMYQAKAAGRNTARFFGPDMRGLTSVGFDLYRSLRIALTQEQFVLYYQPQLNSNGAVTGAEALIRWKKKDGKLRFPSEFIQAAEATGQIVDIGRWVLRTASRQLAEWTRSPDTAHLSLSVNISARQFVEPDFVSMAEGIFRDAGIDFSRLKIELTESLLLTDVGTTAAKMGYLQSLGIKFSLDDFGTGYSSLTYLRKLPLDELKIDYSFMRDVLTCPSDASIVRSIIALGFSLGLHVIAEGVETESQREFLEKAGCRSYQGFLYQKAIPNEVFVNYVVGAAAN